MHELTAHQPLRLDRPATPSTWARAAWLLYAFGEREKIIDFYEMVGGQRMMTSYIRIGGVKEDLPEGFDEKVRAWANPCLKAITMIAGC